MFRVGWCTALLALGSLGCDAAPAADVSGTAGAPVFDDGVAGTAGAGAKSEGPIPEGFLQDPPVGARLAAPTRRLTRAEYQNTVRELFAVEPPPAYLLPEDSTSAGFTSTAHQLMTIASANRYLDAAISVGERLLPTIARLMPCLASDAAGQRECVADWLDRNGTRVFRRPLRDAEKTRFLAAFSRTRASESYEQSASVVVEALLTSPELLFIELPSGAPTASEEELDDWQLASRLSLLLWDSIPDAELLDAAAGGRLTRPDELTAQVRRMLQDPRAHGVIRAFFDDWLGLPAIAELGSDPNGYPVLSRELASSLLEETRAYTEDVFWGEGGLPRLYVSSTRFRNELLSNSYDDHLSSHATLQRFEAEVSDQSFGLLSQAGFLMAMAHAEETSPIHRGAFLRRKLLCGRLPPAPPGLATPLPALSPGLSKRQTIAQHTSSGACAACHDRFNALGFALDQFDIAGRFRSESAGVPVDAHVTFDEPGLRADVHGARELSEALANSDAAHACALQELFSFVLEREPTSADSQLFDELGRHFQATGLDLQQLLAELISSHDFRTRIEPGDAP